MQTEIREYKLQPPFDSRRIYQAIFINGHKTNFWRLKDQQPTDFLINHTLEELQSWEAMIKYGKIKPSGMDEDSLNGFDICAGNRQRL